MVHQAMRGQASREMEDISESQISYSEAAAVAAGDTRILDMFRLRQDISRLESLESDWVSRRASLLGDLRKAEREHRDHTDAAKRWGAAAKDYEASKSRFEKVHILFDGETHPAVTDADFLSGMDHGLKRVAQKLGLPWEDGRGVPGKGGLPSHDWDKALREAPATLALVNGGIAELRAVGADSDAPLGIRVQVVFPGGGAAITIQGVGSVRSALGGLKQYAGGAAQSAESAERRIRSLRDEIPKWSGEFPQAESLNEQRSRLEGLERDLYGETGEDGTLHLPAPAEPARPGRPSSPERRNGAKGDPIRISDIWEAMRRTGPVREGKTGRGNLGTYGQRTDVVRTRNAGDLDAAMHEMGHRVDQWADFSGRASGTAWEVELERAGLVVAPKKATKMRVLQEGVAQFLRYRATNPGEARGRFPRFSQEFESFLDEDPRGEGIRRILDMSLEYRTQGIQERVIAAIGGGNTNQAPAPWKTRVEAGLRRLYDLWVDELAPLRRIGERVAAEHQDLAEAAARPYLSLIHI